ncbi:hypothetical protein CWM52_23060 [Raoultella sp. T31]|nr:hypothetical protein CWM52_23060 [Raoultella sp. T31]
MPLKPLPTGRGGGRNVASRERGHSVADQLALSDMCNQKWLFPKCGNTLLQMQIVINNIINKKLHLLRKVTVNIGLMTEC